MGLDGGKLEQVQRLADEAFPGVSTVRINTRCTSLLPQSCRETEIELGFVCKKCRLGFPREAALLAHQRNVCYPGELADSRGAIRLLGTQFECRKCMPIRVFQSVQELFRHETDAHKSDPQTLIPFKPDSGLTHEMENVVNQITALAAQVAKESSPDSNANFSVRNKELCADSKLGHLQQTAVPIHSSGH